MNEKTTEITKEEWRQLGFFCDRNDDKKLWILIGSPYGLSKFAKLLTQYVKNNVNQLESEHEHFGPYGYLKIMTWNTPGISADAIFGTLSDLDRLASLIMKYCTTENINKEITIGKQYCASYDYELILQFKPYGFDPAVLDEQLW